MSLKGLIEESILWLWDCFLPEDVQPGLRHQQTSWVSKALVDVYRKQYRQENASLWSVSIHRQLIRSFSTMDDSLQPITQKLFNPDCLLYLLPHPPSFSCSSFDFCILLPHPSSFSCSLTNDIVWLSYSVTSSPFFLMFVAWLLHSVTLSPFFFRSLTFVYCYLVPLLFHANCFTTLD